MPSVSLCTTCRGRLGHLKETLPANLLDNPEAEVEFVVLDYNSSDGLEEWVLSNFQPTIESGRLNLFRESEAPYFRMTHAKNVCLAVARGRVVVNVDADVYTGKGFARWLAGLAENVYYRRPVGDADLRGCIGAWRSSLLRVGGYDERMTSGWGYDDDDITHRLEIAGIRVCGDYCGQSFISHGDEERVANSLRKSKFDSLREHNEASWAARVRGDVVANKGRKIGAARLTKNGTETVFSGELIPSRIIRFL